MTLKIVCINAGNYCGRGAEYVNVLHDMVRRNLPAGLAGEFVCFTDEPKGLHGDIIARPLPSTVARGWWQKVFLFQPELFEPGDRIVYLDLDTLVIGRLDDIVAYDGEFAILRDFWSAGWQSSVMAWRAGFGGHIWREFVAKGMPDIVGGDQVWIMAQQQDADILQDIYPGKFVSYKAEGGRIHPTASVVVFHGRPRPHEVTAGWVPEVWKVGGIMRSDLDTICNTATDRIFANVRVNSARRVAWFDTADPHDQHAVIVGGGPSAASRLDEIRWRRSLGQRIWALNGSAAWLRSHGVVPQVHVIVDARPENITFLEKPSQATRYLIGSQCDPALFDRLDDYDVTLWHSNAPGVAELLAGERNRPVHLIGGGSTVGLSAMVLAHSSGFRKLHLYGFDSSIAETGSHAFPQAMNDGDIVVDVMVGERKFRAAPWMAQQAEEFICLASELTQDGTVITAAGDGLIPYMMRLAMEHPRATPAQQRAMTVLRRLGSVAHPRGAEIGVFAGEMSAALLEGREDLSLVMVDSWEADGAAYAADSGDWHARLSAGAQEAFQDKAREATAFAGRRRTIIQSRSAEAAAWVPDASLDFVFIDADHSEAGCHSDIETWAPKIRPGGWLGGHDYENPAFPLFGVKQAVDRFVASTGRFLERDDNMTWFVRV